MSTTTASPYAHLPQVNQLAVLPNNATQNPASQPSGTAAGRRSFRSFVEAMDDFSFDRRDVAGMRQILAMQEDNQRAQAAQPTPPVANVASFAPAPPEPELPVVPGLNLTGQGGNAQALPRLPTFAAGPSADLPHLPTGGQAITPKSASIPATELPRLQPSSDRTVAVMTFAPQPQAQPAANPQTSSLPPQLQSPMIDQVRDATRTGRRPGISDEARARFAANSERRRAPVAPMPPRLVAQEARWNRDAWPATVSSTGAQPAQASAAPAAAAPSSATQTALDLPRLPTLPTLPTTN